MSNNYSKWCLLLQIWNNLWFKSNYGWWWNIRYYLNWSPSWWKSLKGQFQMPVQCWTTGEVQWCYSGVYEKDLRLWSSLQERGRWSSMQWIPIRRKIWSLQRWTTKVWANVSAITIYLQTEKIETTIIYDMILNTHIFFFFVSVWTFLAIKDQPKISQLWQHLWQRLQLYLFFYGVTALFLSS